LDELKKHKIEVSVSRKGDSRDNAVAESFFATIKKELVHRQSWATATFRQGRDLESAVFEYIEAYYNTIRRHSAVGYRAPNQVEQSTASCAQLKKCQLGRGTSGA
jgi:transposase InsO family protein